MAEVRTVSYGVNEVREAIALFMGIPVSDVGNYAIVVFSRDGEKCANPDCRGMHKTNIITTVPDSFTLVDVLNYGIRGVESCPVMTGWDDAGPNGN